VFWALETSASPGAGSVLDGTILAGTGASLTLTPPKASAASGNPAGAGPVAERPADPHLGTPIGDDTAVSESDHRERRQGTPGNGRARDRRNLIVGKP
jgi:hypothetical protein